MSDWRLDDPVWVKRRKAIWRRLKPRLKPELRLEFGDYERYFLTGELGELSVAAQVLFHASDDSEVLRAVLERGLGADSGLYKDPPYFAAWRLLDYTRSLLEQFCFDGPLGMFGGHEEAVIRASLPEHYRAERLILDGLTWDARLGNIPRSAPGFPYPPRQFHTLFTHMITDFLTYPVGNLFHPWQYVWRQWLEALCLPEVAEAEDWLGSDQGRNQGGTAPILRQIFRCVQRFAEPRGLPGEDTTVRRFAAELRAGLEQAELPPTLRATWDFVQTPEGWLERRSAKTYFYGDCLVAVKTLHGATAEPDLLAELVALYQRLGFTDQVFRAEDRERVDIGPLISTGFARDLGYIIDAGRGGRERCPIAVPAWRYRLRCNGRFTALDNRPGSEIAMVFVEPERAPGFTPDDTTPWFLSYPEYGPLYDAFRPSHEAMLNERLVRRLWTQERGHDWVSYSGYLAAPDGLGYDEAGLPRFKASDRHQALYCQEDNPIAYANFRYAY